MTTVDFTDEEINILKNLLESKDKELYSINKNFHTVWFQCESSEAELRITFLSNVQLTISRVCVSHKRRGIMTSILQELINKFTPDPSASIILNEFIGGDWVLNI